MAERRRKFWGWGWEDEGPNEEQKTKIAALLSARFAIGDVEVASPPRIEEIALRAPRVKPPASLAAICTDDPYERAGHTYGKSFRDVVRAFERDFRNPPDLVALPRDENDITALLDWCTGERIAAVPYGGGSSVVGGVEPPAAMASRRGVDRSAPARPRPRDRSRLARRAHPGRRARAGAGGSAAAARLHAAALPAVVRVLDPRRLDRDPLGRPLRDALHAHRRLRRIAARRHTDRGSSSRAACRAAAPGRARTACSSARKASSASSPKPGCACRTGRASAPRRASRSPTSSPPPAPCGRSARPASILPTAGCSMPARRSSRGAGSGSGVGAHRRLRIRRPRARRVDGARARMLPRSRRQRARRRRQDAHRRRSRSLRRSRRLAAGVSRRAVPARRAGRHGHDLGDVRDRDHVGSLREPSTAR